MERYQVLGGRVQVYKRPTSRFWHCSASIKGQQHRETTKVETLPAAMEFAEDWFLTLAGKARAGLLKTERTFEETAKKFLEEYEVITEGQRSPKWVESHGGRLKLHILPFLGALPLSEVTPGKVQDYRVHRAHNPYVRPKKKVPDEDAAPAKEVPIKRPSRSTIHNEIVTIRLVLKTAIRHGWLAHLPDLSPPYKTQGKVVHRPWFSPAEYKQLYEATRAHARMAREQHRWGAAQVHDLILFLGNTGLRPDEARNLQHRDVSIVHDDATGETILQIEVRGKRGVGFCKSMPGAVKPYQRLLSRALPASAQGRRARRRRGETGEPRPLEPKYPQPTDLVFPGNHIKLFNNVLKRTKLKLDRDGNPRTLYSLRHTYICLRLTQGADIYQVAKNCRTSVEMIERFYARHIASTLDAAAINVRKPHVAPRLARA